MLELQYVSSRELVIIGSGFRLSLCVNCFYFIYVEYHSLV